MWYDAALSAGLGRHGVFEGIAVLEICVLGRHVGLVRSLRHADGIVSQRLQVVSVASGTAVECTYLAAV